MGNKYLEKIAKTLSEADIDHAASMASVRSSGAYHAGLMGGPLALATGAGGTHYANEYLHRRAGRNGDVKFDGDHLINTTARGLGGSIAGATAGGLTGTFLGGAAVVASDGKLPLRRTATLAGLVGAGAGSIIGNYYGHKSAHKNKLRELLSSKK